MVGSLQGGSMAFQSYESIGAIRHGAGNADIGMSGVVGVRIDEVREDDVFETVGALETPACGGHLPDQEVFVDGSRPEVLEVAVEEKIERGVVLMRKDGIAGG